MWRYLAFLTILSVFLSSSKCSNELQQAQIYNTWMHSFEEDNAGVKVYRPNSYNFPPARGRSGFTITRNGEFVMHEIAPTDGINNRKGKWKLKDDKSIEVKMDDSGETFELDIVSLQKDVLTIREKK